RQRLHRAVGDAADHVDAGDRRGGQRADVRARVSRVVDVQYVGVVAAIHGEQCADAVDRAGDVADVDRVRAVAGVDVGGAADGAHVDDVGAGFGVDRQRGARAIDVHRVVALRRVDRGLSGQRALD